MNDRLDAAIRAAASDIIEAAPAPPPDPVDAARRRHTIPFWVLPVLVLLPVFGFMYVRALTSDASSEPGPLSLGAELYSKCATCHGGSGGGVAAQGYALAGGEVLATFPRIEDQIRFVHYGTAQYRQAGVDVYGDPNREGGAHVTGQRGDMPPFGGELSTVEIVAVVCHERYTLGGAEPSSDTYVDEYDAWCAPDAAVFAALDSGQLNLVDLGPDLVAIDGTDIVVTPIGLAPLNGGGPQK